MPSATLGVWIAWYVAHPSWDNCRRGVAQPAPPSPSPAPAPLSPPPLPKPPFAQTYVSDIRLRNTQNHWVRLVIMSDASDVLDLEEVWPVAPRPGARPVLAQLELELV